MTPPPNPETATTSRKQTRIAVYIATAPGVRPTEDNEDPHWIPVSISERSGAGLMEATLVYDLGRKNPRGRLQNLHLNEQQNRQIEIWQLDADDGSRVKPLFWGEIVEIHPTIDTPDQLTLIARVQPEHFGDICEGMQVWDEAASDLATVHEDPVFNPVIDGVPVDNRAFPNFEHDNLPTDSDGRLLYFPWIDAESTRTTAAIAVHGDMDVETWNLDQAVETLCYWLNGDQTHVDNFTRAAVSGAVRDLFETAPELSDVKLSRGQHLPQLLDDLLPRHGYSWTLIVRKKEISGADHAKPWIVLYKRGESVLKRDVKLQKPDADHDTAKDELQSSELTISIADLANRIVGHGSAEEVEITIPLVRGWLATLDSQTASDLDLNQEGGLLATLTHVWRLFVGNEGGDYNGLRTEITAPPDLASLFTTYIPKRRPIGHCLTQLMDADGQLARRPVYLEYSVDGGTTWLPAEGGKWGYRLLPDQIGILFTGQTPPEELIAAGADARLRLTGTILGDSRLRYDAERQEKSANSNDLTLFLDVSDRFHKRERIAEGDFASQFTIAPAGEEETFEAPPADERDDTAALTDYCDKLRDSDDIAGVAATLSLPGLHHQYQIGTIIKGIDGRRISFNRLAKSSGEERYPQIVSRTLTFAPEMTTLNLEPFDVV